ncbi:MAG: hypothetical protein WCG47_31600, partial [Dermatophilaceae bacterium]
RRLRGALGTAAVLLGRHRLIRPIPSRAAPRTSQHGVSFRRRDRGLGSARQDRPQLPGLVPDPQTGPQVVGVAHHVPVVENQDDRHVEIFHCVHDLSGCRRRRLPRRQAGAAPSSSGA